MYRVGKMVPPKRQILKDISLSFFPGAKIGILGLNGSGKSSLLRIMAGIDAEFDGDAAPAANLTIGYLEQEPKLDADRTVRETVEEGLGELLAARQRLDALYGEYGNPEADFDKLAARGRHLLAECQAVEHQKHGGCIVVDDGRGLGAGELAEQALDMVVAVAARALGEIVFEVAGARCRERRRLDRLARQRRPAEIGVQHRAGQVEDRTKRRPEFLHEAICEARTDNALDAVSRSATRGKLGAQLAEHCA